MPPSFFVSLEVELRVCFSEVFQIILKDSQAWEVVAWLAEVLSALTFWDPSFLFFFLFLCEVIISRWNCRPQNFLLGEIDDDSWLFIPKQKKPGDLCSSNGFVHVTLGRPVLSSCLSASIKGGGGPAHQCGPGIPGGRGQSDGDACGP